MKNLKKVLSLVLALAMALSLMTVAFAADAKDYADYGEVNYNEAVDVMTAIGVFDGMGGEFNPDGTLTREQAAKIITYMIMGKAEADKLVTTVAPYADVAADRWSAGAIAWCTNEGIISGMGNNRFAPTDNVTGLQFAKMLLVALGYDATIQKLTGDSWAINTATLAINADLDNGMEEVSLSADLTREQACQMAFNTMKADTVEYDSRTSIDINGAQVTIGNNKAYAVTTTKDWGENISDDNATGNAGDPYTVQFAEQYCRDLTLNGNQSEDAFGRPAHTWKYDNDKIGTYADEVALVYTTGVKGIDLADDVEDAGYEFGKDANTDKYNNVNVIRNGGEADVLGDTEISALVDNNNEISGNGVVLELYANDKDEITTAVAVVTYLAEVKTIVKDKSSTQADESALRVEYKDTTGATRSITLTDDTAGFSSVYGNVEVGDYVLVTPKGDNSQSTTALTVAIPETVTAAITKVNTKDAELTIGGEIYSIAMTGNQTYAADTDEVVVYLDQNGYVMAATNQSDNSDSAVAVLKVYSTLNDDGAIVPMIQGVTSDGETVNWETNMLMNKNSDVNKVFTYTEDDGIYTLTLADDTTLANKATYFIDNTTAFDTNTKSLSLTGGKAYFASDVKFIFINDGKATVVEGVQKVVAGKDAWATIKVEDGVNYITALYVQSAPTNTSTTSDELVFVYGAQTGTVSVLVDGEKETFYTYDAYINGEEVNFYTESNSAKTAFYTVEIDNDSGAYVLTDNEYKTETGNLAVTSGDATVTNVAGNVLSTAKDFGAGSATIIDLTDHDLDSLAAIKEAKDAGDTIKVRVIYNEDDMTASYIYVVDYTAHA